MRSKTLDELLAEATIKDLQMRYCRGADRLDWELMRECFHPDAQLVFFEETGLDAFFEMGRTVMAGFSVTTHNTGNQLVEVDGDSAWAEHYCVATHRIPADEQGPERDFVTAVRYVDRVERRDGDWRIARRVLILDWTRSDLVGDVQAPSARNGARGRQDPSYTLSR